MTSLRTAGAFREARRPSTLPAHNREHTSMAAHNHVALLLLPMNVQSASACSSMISTSRNIRWVKRFAAVEALQPSDRAMFLRAWPVHPKPSQINAHSLVRAGSRPGRIPLPAPIAKANSTNIQACRLTDPPQTVQRYRQRRPQSRRIPSVVHDVAARPFSTVVMRRAWRRRSRRSRASLKCTWREPAVVAQDLGE